MFRLRGLRGDRLLQALSAHFDLCETKVTADGLVQTRLYQKYGFSIREQIRLPLGDHRPPAEASDSPDFEDESAEPAGESSNQLINLAEAMKPIQEIAPQPLPAESGDRDRLLQALTADFDLSETRVTANGRVQTRRYKKYGLHIQERIQLRPEDDQADPDVAGDSLDEAATALSNRLSNGLRNLAVALKPIDLRSTPVQEIAPSISLLRSIRSSLAELYEMLSDEDPRPTICEPIEDNVPEPYQEPSISSPPAVYGVLSKKQIALIGFSESQMESTRRGFEHQFSQVMPVDWNEVQSAMPILAGADLMVLRLKPDEDGRRLEGLATMNKPTLLAGDMGSLIQLDPEYSGTPFDFVAPPFHVAEIVWRSATLLTRSSGVAGHLGADVAQASACRVETHLDACPWSDLTSEASVEARDPPEQEVRKTVRVLIAEDDPATATLLETVLSSHGMECHLARNGEDAFEMARSKQVDVSILEIGLPGLDGFQILAALKRDPDLAKVRVVFLTARQNEADILRAFGLGADDYITKPFSPMEVAARLKRILGRSQ